MLNNDTKLLNRIIVKIKKVKHIFINELKIPRKLLFLTIFTKFLRII